MQRSKLHLKKKKSHKIIQEPTKTSISTQTELKEKYRFKAMVYGIRE